MTPTARPTYLADIGLTRSLAKNEYAVRKFEGRTSFCFAPTLPTSDLRRDMS